MGELCSISTPSLLKLIKHPSFRYNTNGYGNPWFLATNAFAELCYGAASRWWRSGEIRITRNLAVAIEDIVSGGLLGQPTFTRQKRRQTNHKWLPVTVGEKLTIYDHPAHFLAIIGNLTIAGDAFLRRVRRHIPHASGDQQIDFSISEQFNRWSGFMQGAPDLGWSHASILTTKWAREDLLVAFAESHYKQ
jgi:glucoamylase